MRAISLAISSHQYGGKKEPDWKGNIKTDLTQTNHLFPFKNFTNRYFCKLTLLIFSLIKYFYFHSIEKGVFFVQIKKAHCCVLPVLAAL